MSYDQHNKHNEHSSTIEDRKIIFFMLKWLPNIKKIYFNRNKNCTWIKLKSGISGFVQKQKNDIFDTEKAILFAYAKALKNADKKKINKSKDFVEVETAFPNSCKHPRQPLEGKSCDLIIIDNYEYNKRNRTFVKDRNEIEKKVIQKSNKLNLKELGIKKLIKDHYYKVVETQKTKSGFLLRDIGV